MSKQLKMRAVQKNLENLTQSPLYAYRIEHGYVPVIGEGNLDAKIMFIGEAPGKNEAISGKPFCGASGKVLDQLLLSAGLDRESVYITNIVKDRPQDNRDPKPFEIDLYAPFLKKQIDIIRPTVIAPLGRFSSEFVLKEYARISEVPSITQLHGTVYEVVLSWGTVHVVPLFHPAVAVYNRKRLDELCIDIKKIKKLIQTP